MTFKDLREQLTPAQIKEILRREGVEPHYENASYIIYPTVCHNPIGMGSYKLYYYTNTHLFKCFTTCNSVFDIFDLLIKIEDIKGHNISKVQAIELTGLKISSQDLDVLSKESIASDIAHLTEINYTRNFDPCKQQLPIIDDKFLDNRFVFDVNGLKSWMNEGISLNSMLRYKITYDPIENCIIIPHFDAQGNVVGVRGRFLNPDAPAKYKPITFNGQVLNHPTGQTLYGYYQNFKALQMTRAAILVEGEKSVLKLDTLYDKNNIALAVSGQNISREHIQMLINANVNNVVIAFDADYRNYNEAQEKLADYKRIGRPLKTYFNVSIIIDFDHRLDYKDAPIDKGEQIFNELMKERVYI